MAIRPRVYIAASLLSLAAAGGTRGAVGASAPDHLVLTYRFQTRAAPAKAYASVVDVAHWWSSDHTYSGNAKNLAMTARAGGCWCETWNGGSVQHMTVLLAMPGKLLRLSGGLGPLQGAALAATLTFELKPAAAGSEVTVSYVVGGFIGGGLDKIAPGVDGVLGAQLQRLGRLIDTGSAEEAAKKS